jgi:hypothetical protein
MCKSRAMYMQEVELCYTCAISSDVLIMLAMPFRLVTTESTAIEIPRLKSIEFIPAATDLHPSVNIAFVKTVAQVVPEIIGHERYRAVHLEQEPLQHCKSTFVTFL